MPVETRERGKWHDSGTPPLSIGRAQVSRFYVKVAAGLRADGDGMVASEYVPGGDAGTFACRRSCSRQRWWEQLCGAKQGGPGNRGKRKPCLVVLLGTVAT